MTREEGSDQLLQVDVAICGGGLAGLTLARQLKRGQPSLSVAVLDRLARPLPKATLKVGESTVEIGAFYFAEVLGLRDYLESSHLRKLGLRFFFKNGAASLWRTAQSSDSRSSRRSAPTKSTAESSRTTCAASSRRTACTCSKG